MSSEFYVAEVLAGPKLIVNNISDNEKQLWLEINRSISFYLQVVTV